MFRKIMWVVSVLNVVASAVVLALHPQSIVPIHFGVNGQPDNWGNKWILLSLAVLPLFAAIVYEVYMLYDQKNVATHKNREVGNKLMPSLELFLVTFNWIMLAIMLSRNAEDKTSFETGAIAWTIVAMGLFIMVIGRFMDKIQPNGWLGIRTPWTLKSKIVWRKTHQFTRIVWLFAGLAMVIWGAMCWFFPVSITILFTVFFLILFIMALIPIIYSWRFFKNLNC